jgi:hypothetical protein
MDPLSLISLGVGGIGAIGGIINKFASSGKLQALEAQDPTYKVSPYAANQLSLASSLLNARMPGATAMQRNIYQNQANQLGNVNRNATDSSQALAMGATAQGQTNQAFSNLSTQEQQDYYNRLQNMNSAQQVMSGEWAKQQADQVRRFGDVGAITGAQMQNTATGYNSIANLGFGGAGLASLYGINAGTNGNAGALGNLWGSLFGGNQAQAYSGMPTNYMGTTTMSF